MILLYIKIILILYFCVFFGSKMKHLCCVVSEREIFIIKKKNKIESIVVIMFFIIFFVCFYRFVRLFFLDKNRMYFDIKSYINFDILFDINKIFIIFIFVFVFLNLRRFFACYIKFNYLRLHYYYFFRSYTYRKVINKPILLKSNFFHVINNNRFFYLLFFFRNFIMKLIFVIIFLKNIFFDNMIIFVGHLIFYGFILFIISMINFFCQMESDFELGTYHCYYPNIIGTTDLGINKLLLYHKKLIKGESNFHFMNSIIYSLKLVNKVPNTWIFYFYSPSNIIDVFLISKSKKYRPHFLSK